MPFKAEFGACDATAEGRWRAAAGWNENSRGGRQVFLALELEEALSGEGAEFVGPSHTVAEAHALACEEVLTAAVLDVQLGQDTVSPVAQELSDRGIPFLFHTGQSDIEGLHREWPGCKIVRKPVPSQILVAAVAGLLAD